MLYIPIYFSISEVLFVVLPALLNVAFVTVAERKTMASMQRRLGPNIVGFYGILQAFADALKLLLKEYVSPSQANLMLFFLGPIITLIFSLLGYAVIPYAPGLALFDYELGVLFILAVSSIATYGILLAGWSANSKYAFLGSLRSTAQLISYELVLSSAIFLVILLTSSLNLTVNIEAQRCIYFLAPLYPIFQIFFNAAIAETNRAPFDLAEAESELVSGFMTEHSAVVFVFFFLAEYASIVLICILTSIFFVGGYVAPFDLVTYMLDSVNEFVSNIVRLFYTNIYTLDINNLSGNVFSEPKIENILYGLSLAVKTFVMIFIFIWVRASNPRVRYDQLMSYCWTRLLPIVFAFIIMYPCFMHMPRIMPNNIVFLDAPECWEHHFGYNGTKLYCNVIFSVVALFTLGVIYKYSYNLVHYFTSRLESMYPSASGRICKSCHRVLPPNTTICPYCGVKPFLVFFICLLLFYSIFSYNGLNTLSFALNYNTLELLYAPKPWGLY